MNIFYSFVYNSSKKEKGLFPMNNKRALEIVTTKRICDVYYQNHPVWIQEIENHVAKIGYMDLMKEQEVPLKDLYE